MQDGSTDSTGSTAAKPNPQVPIFGTPIAIATYQSVVDQVKIWGEEKGVKTIAAVNVHNVTLATEDKIHATNLKTFDLIVPDGMPLVWWINRFSKYRLADRVYGPSLMLHCLEASQQWPGSHFLMGSTQAVLDSLQIKLLQRFPKIKIAGAYSPPFGEWSEEENLKIIRAIGASGAQFIWIGLGCPKQERWLAVNKARLPNGVYFAVGAAFPMHAGMLKQAPPWMQKNGLEWVFRLMMEPKRMWLRTVKYNSRFVYLTILQSLSKRPIH